MIATRFLAELEELNEALLDAKNEKGVNDEPTGADGFRINDMLDFVMQKHKGELNGVPQSVQGEVLRVLQSDDEYLTGIVHQFGKMRQQSNSAKITCFIEIKQCNVRAMIGDKTQIDVVVTERSGCLDGTDKYALERGHFAMNKFEKADDADFKIVRKEIKDMMKRASGIFLDRFRGRRAQDQRPQLNSLHGPTYIKEARHDRLFWQHLTSASHELYEDIYDACMINGGNVGKNIDCC
ncbi:hypothetical protein VE02_04639 [Pseudogymnoascus sp. 03VT05]|nr:hypothetical protein VE02_04639 [Pseudogymnoascus sp. 03VT05]